MISADTHLAIRALLFFMGAWALAGCNGDDEAGQAVGPPPHQSDLVQKWSLKAAEVYNASAQFPDPVTDVERRPAWPVEMATVHVAMHDAIMALGNVYAGILVRPATLAPDTGPAQDAAVTAAAYGVIREMWPDRAAIYQKLYDDTLSSLYAGTSGDDVRAGLAVGAEVAARVMLARANDGRMLAFGPHVSATAPGGYRVPPVPLASPYIANIKPFKLKSASQFRAPGPYLLTDPRYTNDFNETRDLGSVNSTLRTATQTSSARFHTEAPNIHWPRNLAQFSHWQPGSRSLADDARLSAMIWVSVSDSIVACWDSKFHYYSWRPQSAIVLAGTDGNDDTVADASWVPLGPVPPHPEYPAAHACVSAAVAESLAIALGTRNLSFTFEALTVTPAVPAHTYASVDQMAEDNFLARIWGGQHFRKALDDGKTMGEQVARLVNYNSGYIGPIF